MNPPPRLTTGAALGHIRRMAGPASLGLFCNMLFNITDTFYAGWLGTEAQAALAFSFPLFFLQVSYALDFRGRLRRAPRPRWAAKKNAAQAVWRDNRRRWRRRHAFLFGW